MIRLDRAARPFYLDPMCGRFTQHLSWAEIHRLADLIGQPRNLAPRFNIAPTTQIEVVRAGEAGNELVPMRWGLVPSWWKKSLNELPSTFNARAETVTEKPMFRAAFKARRCIIPASGFYEWTGKAGAKTPHYFSAPSGEPLALAGLWERWRDPESDASFDSATIIVGAASKWMSRFHVECRSSSNGAPRATGCAAPIPRRFYAPRPRRPAGVGRVDPRQQDRFR